MKLTILTATLGLLVSLTTSAAELPVKSYRGHIGGHLYNLSNTDLSTSANPYLPARLHAHYHGFFSFKHLDVSQGTEIRYTNALGRGCAIKLVGQTDSIVMSISPIKGNELCRVNPSHIVMNAD